MKIFLFDMDGTLTEPRKRMSQRMCNKLRELQNIGYQVGIVTGSDLNYIMEQCHLINELPGLDYSMLDLYPCNGTKHYRIGKFGYPDAVYINSFRKHVGDEEFTTLVYSLASELSLLSLEGYSSKLPLTGNFINYRGSMINFCPIGRNADQEERAQWIKLDKEFKIRKTLVDRLSHIFENKNIVFKLGGDTSVDIFPLGWDKTYVLRNFKKEEEVWFIGDKCDDLGNDKELYDAIKLRSSGESFKTNGPIKTIEIIEKFILSQPR